MKTRRRQFLKTGLLAGAAAQAPRSAWARVIGANDAIRVGVAGVNGMGWGHVERFHASEGARVVAICDPDRGLLERRRAEFATSNPRLSTFSDIRAMLDQRDLDAVVVATPDHWHALAGLWAMQAGKDVYIEKPLTYCISEGPRLVAAARKYGRVAQTGSQHRSCPATHAARELIQSGKLGKLQWAYVVVFNRRPSIGRADGPLAIPKDVDYGLYAGPASDDPPVRKQLHYDWHWQWSMGTGEAANWGAHVMDDALNLTGITRAPRSVRSIGGRLGYDDDGETPNTMLVAYDVGDFPLLAQFRALPMKTGMEAMDHYRGIRLGTVIQCENGYYAGGRGGGWIHDNGGKRVEQVEGDGGSGHVKNFLDAVRSRRPQDVTAPMQVGHISALYCHLANMSYRLGQKATADAGRAAMQGSRLASEQLESMIAHLARNDVDTSKPALTLGGLIQMDALTDTCVGPNAAEANALATRRYREPFLLPEDV